MRTTITRARKYGRLHIFIFLLAFLIASPARGQEPSLQKPVDPPKPTLRHRVFDKKFLFVTAANVGFSIAATRSLVKCRHDHGIGPCTDGGYGEFKTREGLRQGLTGGLAILSYFHKQAEDEDGGKYKFWWLFQAGNTAVNAGVIVQNARKHYGPRDGT